MPLVSFRCHRTRPGSNAEVGTQPWRPYQPDRQHAGRADAARRLAGDDLQSRFPEHELVVRNLGFSGDADHRGFARKASARPRRLADQERNRRRLRLLRLQRIVRRRGRPASNSSRTSTSSSSTRSAEVQRQAAAAARALLADRPRGPRQRPQPARRRGEQRAAEAVHRRHGRSRPRRTAWRSSICSRPRKELFAQAEAPLTINGIHLNEAGEPSRRRDHRPGPVRRGPVRRREPQPAKSSARRCSTRTSTGSTATAPPTATRSTAAGPILTFVDGQTNRVVLQREMEVLDVMTANRDQRDLGRRARRRTPRSTTATRRRSFPCQDQQARRRSRRQAHLPRRRRGDQAHDRRQGAEGQPVRLGRGIPRAGQPGADGVRHQGPAVGRRLADLSALEAQGADERQAADPRRHRRRRQGRHCKTLRRRPAQPDRLRVLERRRARGQGAGPVFLKDTDGDDKADVARAHAPRPRLGRHAPHGQQLRARSGRRALLPGRDVPPHAGRNALRPAGRAANAGVFRYEPRRRSSRSTSPTASPTRTATSFDRWGQDIVTDGTGASPYHGAVVLRPRRLPGQARPARRRSTSSGPAPAPAPRFSPAATSPTSSRAICWCAT